MRYLIYFMVAAFVFFPVLTMAQELDESLFFCDDDLVVTASKEAQKVSEAPAIIDVISQEQLKNFDATNLYEVLSFLPGIELMETYWGRTVLNFRGVMNYNYSNKVLLMIDGNAFYEPVNGSFFLESIPISAIARIEVIRGPGSSLYGTNAYSGVINVITHQATESDKNLSLRAGYGSFNTVQARIAGELALTENLHWFLSAELINSDGYTFNVVSDEAENSGELDYEENDIRLLTNVEYKNLSLQFGYFNQEKMAYGIVPDLDYSGIHEHEIIFANAMLSHNFTENQNLTLYLRYNNFQSPSTDIGRFPKSSSSTVHLEFGGSLSGVELQMNSQFCDNFSLVTGVAYEYLTSDKYLFIWDDDGSVHPFSAYQHEPDSYNWAGYFQFNYQPTEKVDIIGGSRITKNKDDEDILFAPRAGIIFQMKENVWLKALYGNAFRSPHFFEKYVETYNVLYGSPDLNPEIIHTFDLGIEANLNKYVNARLNGFVEYTEDQIARKASPNPEHGTNAAVYANLTQENIYGIEFATQGKLWDKGNYGFNLSWKDGEDRDSEESLMHFANYHANFWLTYPLHEMFRLTPQVQYIGERDGYTQRSGNYTLDSYVLLNLIGRFDYDCFSISISGKNLLDEDYFYPEYIRQISEKVPGGAERHFVGSVGYNF